MRVHCPVWGVWDGIHQDLGRPNFKAPLTVRHGGRRMPHEEDCRPRSGSAQSKTAPGLSTGAGRYRSTMRSPPDVESMGTHTRRKI